MTMISAVLPGFDPPWRGQEDACPEDAEAALAFQAVFAAFPVEGGARRANDGGSGQTAEVGTAIGPVSTAATSAVSPGPIWWRAEVGALWADVPNAGGAPFSADLSDGQHPGALAAPTEAVQSTERPSHGTGTALLRHGGADRAAGSASSGVMPVPDSPRAADYGMTNGGGNLAREDAPDASPSRGVEWGPAADAALQRDRAPSVIPDEGAGHADRPTGAVAHLPRGGDQTRAPAWEVSPPRVDAEIQDDAATRAVERVAAPAVPPPAFDTGAARAAVPAPPVAETVTLRVTRPSKGGAVKGAPQRPDAAPLPRAGDPVQPVDGAATVGRGTPPEPPGKAAVAPPPAPNTQEHAVARGTMDADQVARIFPPAPREAGAAPDPAPHPATDATDAKAPLGPEVAVLTAQRAPAQPRDPAATPDAEPHPATDPADAPLAPDLATKHHPRDLADATLPSSAAPQAGTPSIPAPAASAPIAPLHPAQQVAAAVIAATGHEIDLRLDPEELGAVRVTLVPEGDQIRVTCHAERAETLDLLRRGVGQLAADLRDLGFSNASFSFGRQANPDRRPGEAQRGPDGTAPRPSPITPTITRSPARAAGLLDKRV